MTSQSESNKSIKSHGPMFLSENVEYDDIKCYGPFTVRASDVNIATLQVHGPMTSNGSMMVNEIKINGPVTADGLIHVTDWGKINGPFTCSGELILEDTATLTVNGPTNVNQITGGDEVVLNGPATVDEIREVNGLQIKGGIDGKLIVARDVYIAVDRRQRDAHLKRIEATDVIIEKSLNGFNDVQGIIRRMLSKIFKHITSKAFDDDDSLQKVDEIVARGKVYLSHARVKKVVARELELGENAEIVEFQKIPD